MTDTLLSDDQTPIVDDKDYFVELVGENKKFKDAQALARSKLEADSFIESLKRENAELRNDFLEARKDSQVRANLQELLDQIKQQQSVSRDNTPSTETTKPSFDPNELKSLVQNELQQTFAQQKENQNFEMVRNKLKERYGSNYSNAYKDQLETLGLTPEVADRLAKTMPNVFMKTFGLDSTPSTQSFQAPPSTNRRSDNFSVAPPKKTWAYYKELKKKDPELYWNPKTQVEMHQMSATLGEAFEDGDFKE